MSMYYYQPISKCLSTKSKFINRLQCRDNAVSVLIGFSHSNRKNIPVVCKNTNDASSIKYLTPLISEEGFAGGLLLFSLQYFYQV